MKSPLFPPVFSSRDLSVILTTKFLLPTSSILTIDIEYCFGITTGVVDVRGKIQKGVLHIGDKVKVGTKGGGQDTGSQGYALYGRKVHG